MSKTVKGLLEHCKTALKNNVQYVYGAKMQVMTYAQIKALQDTYGKSYVWDSDLKKAGKLCCDCSGLISSYTGIARGSTNYADTATDSATIKQLKADWSKYIGWGIWLQGHIGVVSDTEGYYYAMDGSARNMVHLPLAKNNWIKVIKLKDIDYTNVKEDEDDMTDAQVREIAVAVVTENAEKVYNSLDDVPSWGKATVEKLINSGALQGADNGLNINYTLLRLLVIIDRLGLCDK